ncbi:protein of unknown function (plasmid) [Cupriavidus taiwanensis]|nr:protein of unknown function [Cupriavidus taiwanensis]
MSTGSFPKTSGFYVNTLPLREVHLTASPQVNALRQMEPRQPPPRLITSTQSSPRTTRFCRYLEITTATSYC